MAEVFARGTPFPEPPPLAVLADWHTEQGDEAAGAMLAAAALEPGRGGLIE